jgi:futalosine hydrolase
LGYSIQMKILIVAATIPEMDGLIHFLNTNGQKINFFTYALNGNTIYPIVTGIGAMHTAFGVSRVCIQQTFDLAINIGIAGSYSPIIEIGSVIEISQDRFADLGAEDNDGSFLDLSDLKLFEKDKYPYADGWLYSKSHQQVATNLSKVKGITVNKTSGTNTTIHQMANKYNPDVESMEGAGFLYACNILDIPCIQIRAISNFVEPRNKNNWNIPLAIRSLNEVTNQLLQSL